MTAGQPVVRVQSSPRISLGFIPATPRLDALLNLAKKHIEKYFQTGLKFLKVLP